MNPDQLLNRIVEMQNKREVQAAKGFSTVNLDKLITKLIAKYEPIKHKHTANQR